LIVREKPKEAADLNPSPPEKKVLEAPSAALSKHFTRGSVFVPTCASHAPAANVINPKAPNVAPKAAEQLAKMCNSSRSQGARRDCRSATAHVAEIAPQGKTFGTSTAVRRLRLQHEAASTRMTIVLRHRTVRRRPKLELNAGPLLGWRKKRKS